MATRDYDVPAIDRAAKILAHLSLHEDASMAELSAALRIPKSSLFLLLEALMKRRWVEKRDGRYRIGLGLFELGSKYLHYQDLLTAFRSEAAAFVAHWNETIQLAILDGDEIVYVGREDASRPVRLVSDLGTRLPAHATALGKSLLASMPDEELERLLPKELTQLTEHTIRNRGKLLSQLREVRSQSLSWDFEEVAPGLCCVASPIRNNHGQTVAAASAAVAKSRFGEERRMELAEAVRGIAHKMSLSLGNVPSARWRASSGSDA